MEDAVAGEAGPRGVNSDIWCAVPVHNNGRTVADVARECRTHVYNVIVIDDGSTDVAVKSLFEDNDIDVLTHQTNRGKGEAIRTGLAHVARHKGRYMIVVDGDGQHRPSDLKLFIDEIMDKESTIVIGARKFDGPNIPSSSRFGREFSNLWLEIETGMVVSDTQSGFRAYPVRLIESLPVSASYYDYEAEVLTRAVWAGLEVDEIEIDVYYPEPEERISSFRPLLDNLRIAWVHVGLVLRQCLPLPHRRCAHSSERKARGNFMARYLMNNSTPLGLACSAGISALSAVYPGVVVPLLTALYVAWRLHLNKVAVLAVQALGALEIVSRACIAFGSLVLPEGHVRNYHLAGSIILAPLFAGALGFLTMTLARFLSKVTRRGA